MTLHNHDPDNIAIVKTHKQLYHLSINLNLNAVPIINYIFINIILLHKPNNISLEITVLYATRT